MKKEKAREGKTKKKGGRRNIVSVVRNDKTMGG